MLFLVFGLVLNPLVIGLADLWDPGFCFAGTCRWVLQVALWGVLQKLASSLVSEGLQMAAQSFRGEVWRDSCRAVCWGVTASFLVSFDQIDESRGL